LSPVGPLNNLLKYALLVFGVNADESNILIGKTTQTLGQSGDRLVRILRLEGRTGLPGIGAKPSLVNVFHADAIALTEQSLHLAHGVCGQGMRRGRLSGRTLRLTIGPIGPIGLIGLNGRGFGSAALYAR